VPRKSLKVLVYGAFVLIAVAGAAFLWLRSSLPQTSGHMALRGLERPVSIFRDANAVPHIFAETTHDAYFSLGVVHAQDRLWQMEFLRRLGAGRLSEVLGEKTVKTDKYIRTLGLLRVADTIYERLSPAARTALIAYTDGINAWLTVRRGALPPEFLLLRYEPEPWRPADPLLWSRLVTTITHQCDLSAPSKFLPQSQPHGSYLAHCPNFPHIIHIARLRFSIDPVSH